MVRETTQAMLAVYSVGWGVVGFKRDQACAFEFGYLLGTCCSYFTGYLFKSSLGTTVVLFGDYSWLCAQGSLLKVFRESYLVPGIKPGQYICKTDALPSLYYISGPRCYNFKYLFQLLYTFHHLSCLSIEILLLLVWDVLFVWSLWSHT